MLANSSQSSSRLYPRAQRSVTIGCRLVPVPTHEAWPGGLILGVKFHPAQNHCQNMIDPITIATASANLVGTCSKLGVYIRKIQSIDTSIRVLEIEVSTLSNVLGRIATCFSDLAVATVVLEQQTGHEVQYWDSVKTSMDDCQVTLHRLERIIEELGSGGGFVLRSKRTAKLEQSMPEITLLKQQISAYRHSMQLSLQMINL
jgi:hypothetical protein